MEMRVFGIVAAVHLALVGSALASELDSEHLFGLTEGTDIGAKGEREVELEFGGRLDKRTGTYRVLSQASALKLTLTDSFRVAPFVGFDHYRIGGVPNLDDRNNGALSEAGIEFKYRALERDKAPFGLTFAAVPTFGRTDEISGERVSGYSATFAALMDRELITGRLLGAFNLAYATGASRIHATGIWEHDSTLAMSGALSGKVVEGVFVGGEVRYERAYDGMGLDRLAGYGVFIGPSLYARLSDKAWLSAVWNAQVAGRAKDDPGSLDLTNFERHLVKVRLGIQF